MKAGAIRCIDLFCGAGGSSYGAYKAGAEIVAGFDIWKPAAMTFQKNFPDALIFNSDIRVVSPRALKEKLGKIDLILASPECTNHSVAKGNRERCETSKQTAFQVIKFANVLKPKWIIIENVVQMQSWSEHKKFLKQLWSIGYFVREVVLNSKDFGVPQSRNRLFMMCSLSGEGEPPMVVAKEETPVSKILDTSGRFPMTPLRTPKRAIATLERANRAILALGPKQPFIIVYYSTDGSGGWQSIDRPLRTITTIDRFAYVEPHKEGHLMRMLQPDELTMAMGYDKSIDFADDLSRRDRIKLIGNGVCPPVMTAVINGLTRAHS